MFRLYLSPLPNRTALSEKKPVLKPKSPEKARADDKDLEKSPAKKLEGRPPLDQWQAYQSHLVLACWELDADVGSLMFPYYTAPRNSSPSESSIDWNGPPQRLEG